MFQRTTHAEQFKQQKENKFKLTRCKIDTSNNDLDIHGQIAKSMFEGHAPFEDNHLKTFLKVPQMICWNNQKQFKQQ